MDSTAPINSSIAFHENTTVKQISPLSDIKTMSAYDLRLSSVEKDISELKDILHNITDKLEDSDNSVEETNTAIPADIPHADAARISIEARRQIYEDAMAYTTQEDEAWSTSTEVVLEKLILASDELGMAESQRVQCAGSMCKIEVVLPVDMNPYDKDLYTTRMLQAVAGSLPRGTYESTYNPDGSEHVVFYLARKGYGLPNTEALLGSRMQIDSESGTDRDRP